MEDQTYTQETPPQQPHTNTFTNTRLPLPNATSILVMGILSIVCCCCYGIPGLVLGIIALVLANKSNELYQANPDQYTAESYENLKAGKICGLIGLILSSIYFLFVLLYFIFVGATMMKTVPWETYNY